MTLASRSVGARIFEDYDFDTLAAGHMVLWLSAASPSFYELDGSSLVQTAFDRSPRGQDATQASATERPPIVSQSGHDWFDFSTGNDYLTTVSGPMADSAATNTTGARTIFAAYYLPYATHPSTRRFILETYPQYYGGGLEIADDNDPAFTLNDGGVETAAGPSDVPLQQTVVQAGQFLIDDFVYVWLDGTLEDGSNAIQTPLTSSQQGWRIGTYRDANDRWFDGYIGEVVVIDRFLSAAEMALGFEILTRRWS